MKNKKIIIIIFVLLAAVLIGGGAIYYLVQDNKKANEGQDEVLQKKPKVEIDQDAANHEVGKMKSIITPDKKIRFGTTPLYRYGDISGMTINVIPYEDFEKVYLLLTMEMPDSNEDIVICLENLKKKEQIEHEVVSLRDWSKVKGWSVKIITEQEAISLDYEHAES